MVRILLVETKPRFFGRSKLIAYCEKSFPVRIDLKNRMKFISTTFGPAVHARVYRESFWKRGFTGWERVVILSKDLHYDGRTGYSSGRYWSQIETITMDSMEFAVNE